MNASVKLGAFVLTIAASVGAGYALGTIVGPFDGDEPVTPVHEVHAEDQQ